LEEQRPFKPRVESSSLSGLIRKIVDALAPAIFLYSRQFGAPLEVFMPERSIFTTAVHAGERAPSPTFTPVATPVYPSVGYVYEDFETLDAVFGGQKSGPVYARYGNPTNEALEIAMAALEAGEAALSFGSGMAAVYAALLGAGARQGASIVAAQDVYGATYNLLDKLMSQQGVKTHFVDITDLDTLARVMAEVKPVALLAEIISNPLLKVANVPELARLAHAAEAALIVDSTFATPYLCQPLRLGADYVVHSATKYLGGHGDVLGGVIVTSHERRAALNELIKLVGSNLGPQEAWLILRGLKTLPLRLERQCANAAQVAQWLIAQPQVSRVNYPGLQDHPQHDLAGRLYGGRGFGAIISFDLREADAEHVAIFMDSLQLVQPATTLGDVYSLTLYPARSSHRALSPETRRQIGIGDGLVRLSIGIEDPADIIADLGEALRAVGS
jgi:cystathionine beta-lyase/cystathionine gamma-synthase